jgi:nucleotide-binding universal stress UspA family protein
MRIAIGVDWSDQAFTAVTQTFHTYHPSDVTLVHGVDLGMLESPIVAQAANLQGYDDFRNAMVDAGKQLLDRAAAMIPQDVANVRRINEIGSPAQIILNAAKTVAADLIVVGARGRSRVTELVLGSVSHRVVTHASCPTLIVKGNARAIRQVLVAIEGHEDADRIKKWLLTHPFKQQVALSVLTVVPSLQMADPANIVGFQAWSDTAMRYAEDLVKETGAALMSARYTVSTRAVTGEPATMVAQQASAMDLVVVASHGRKGVERFLLGSVSHSIVHQVACPILVVR